MRWKILALLCTVGYCSATLNHQELETFWDEEREENAVNDKQVYQRRWDDYGADNNKHAEEKSFEDDNSVEARALNRGVDLGIVYDFLTTDTTAIGFITGVVGEFVSKTIGWMVINLIWTTARGATVGAELDIPALFEFAVNPTGNVINMAIGTGYVIMNLLTWTILGSIGPMAPTVEEIVRRSEDPDTRSLGADDRKIVLEEGTDTASILSTFDDLFSLQGIARTTVFNFLLGSGFVTFWLVMMLLPKSPASEPARREYREGWREGQRAVDNQLDQSQIQLQQAIHYYGSL